MTDTAAKRVKLSTRINAYVASEAPIRKLAGNWSKKAKVALDEANSLSLEHVEIHLERLPKKLDGFQDRPALRHASQPVHEPRPHQACRKSRQPSEARHFPAHRRLRLARPRIHRTRRRGPRQIKSKARHSRLPRQPRSLDRRRSGHASFPRRRN